MKYVLNQPVGRVGIWHGVCSLLYIIPIPRRTSCYNGYLMEVEFSQLSQASYTPILYYRP